MEIEKQPNNKVSDSSKAPPLTNAAKLYFLFLIVLFGWALYKLPEILGQRKVTHDYLCAVSALDNRELDAVKKFKQQCEDYQ